MKIKLKNENEILLPRRERVPSPPSAPPSLGGWFAFDDTVVSPWDVDNLESHCFGGADGEKVRVEASPGRFFLLTAHWGPLEREKERTSFFSLKKLFSQTPALSSLHSPLTTF